MKQRLSLPNRRWPPIESIVELRSLISFSNWQTSPQELDV